MKKIFILLVCLAGLGYGQITVPYLPEIPKIDGLLDNDTNRNSMRDFPDIYKTRDQNPNIPVKYKTGYTGSYLYLYIEAEADQIIKRDRAYQNGDGFHLMIGKPRPNNKPTDEFYILAFSPPKDWSHKRVWYYNVDLSMQALGEEVTFATHEAEGRIGFELLIPWETIKPYHPWAAEIGLNLCFVKAIREKEKNYHFITMDEKMQSEQSLRKYEIVEFEKPAQTTTAVSMPPAYHIKTGAQLGVNLYKWSKSTTESSISIKIFSGENEVVGFQRENIICTPGLNASGIFLSSALVPGGYRLEVRENNKIIGEHYITILPDIDPITLKSELDNLKPSLSGGSYNSMLFYIETLEQSLAGLKSYENSYTIRENLYQIETKLKKLQKGNDPILRQTGTYRRAFRSKIDSTLRPYSVYVPKDYSPENTYPLLVYLHGSGNDDRVLNHTTSIIGEGFIIVAPNGRGTSNCFSTKESQIDIMEAIKDVKKVFSIDEKNIILSGFSMGGYGVYRTYYEHPELYSAIAVLSGHPNLARKWGGEKALNFLDAENLKKFNSVPIFIFHSRNDLNCPFDLTENLVKTLQSKNLDVTFVIGEEGHSSMSESDRGKYHEWLKQQVK